MFKFFKELFGSKKEISKEEERKTLFRAVGKNLNYQYKGYFENNKMAFSNKEMILVIDLTSGDVTSTKGSRKLKRYGLTDEEIVQVMKDPKVKLEHREHKWMDN